MPRNGALDFAENASSPGTRGAWAGRDDARRKSLAVAVGRIWREIAALLMMVGIHEVARRHVRGRKRSAGRRRRIEIRLVKPIEEPRGRPRTARLAKPVLIVFAAAGRNQPIRLGHRRNDDNQGGGGENEKLAHGEKS